MRPESPRPRPARRLRGHQPMARVPPIVRRVARTSRCGCAGCGPRPDENAVETGPATCQPAGILKPSVHGPQLSEVRTPAASPPCVKNSRPLAAARETRRWGQIRSIHKNSVAGRNETVETIETNETIYFWAGRDPSPHKPRLRMTRRGVVPRG